ncbi:hypothetical protein B296_00008102, partial [Ensete ventricosum]
VSEWCGRHPSGDDKTPTAAAGKEKAALQLAGHGRSRSHCHCQVLRLRLNLKERWSRPPRHGDTLLLAHKRIAGSFRRSITEPMAKGRSKAAGARGGDEIAAPEEAVVGFAKLQGDDFEYYMQTYSIVLGRNSKTSDVDVDLASIGGGMSISRRHARIFYDFPRRRFALEVLGKNGCFVEGVLHAPGAPPVELDSQDLLQIGEKRFYFLLPSRSVFAAGPVPRCQSTAALAPSAGRARSRDYGNEVHGGDAEEEEEAGEDEARRAVVGSSGKRRRRHLGEDNVEEFGRAEEAAPLRHSGQSVSKPSSFSLLLSF